MQFDEKYKRFIKITPAGFLLSVITLIFLSSAFVSGQAGASEITGQVRDAAGGGIDGATIFIMETDTNQSVTVISGDDGFYTVTN